MGSIEASSDIHLVFAPFPAYGHLRPLRSLAKSLVARGYRITFISSDHFKSSLEAIDGVDFYPLAGRANFDPGNVFEKWERPADATIIWDVEHLFFGILDDTFQSLHAVLSRSLDKRVVLLTDGLLTGTLPISLESPQIRRVPVIALPSYPLLCSSKDVAPPGPKPTEQSPEIIAAMNRQMVEVFASAQASVEAALVKYDCKKNLPSKLPLDSMVVTPDAYLMLTVPEMEAPRSDLPDTFRFVGAPLGGNDMKALPDWWQSFVVEDNSQPLIVVTSGTVPGLTADELILPTIEACRDLPVRLVVCTVYVKMQEDLVLPPNTKVAPWLPFEELFKYASIVVSNGGYGGINQAFAAGLPMVVAGTAQDKAMTTEIAARTGAAINLNSQAPTAQQVKDALQQILSDQTYKEKALGLQRSYDALDTVGLVEESILGLSEKFFG
jgi:MGT family glycosyltransferase